VTSVETLYLSTCLLLSFVLRRCCTVNWVPKLLMRAISNVHTDRKFPYPGVAVGT